MRYLKWAIPALVALFLLAFLHYTLPQHDIVRIVGAGTQRMDLGENSWFFAAPDTGTAETASGSRDVKFIQTMFPDGRTMVYRNEDTGWGWPPYFKVNSFDVQAKASDLTSTSETPKWVVITHYGWRNQLFTIFPNAIGLKEVSGPGVTVIPWFNILFFLTLGGLIFLGYRMWQQFRERTIEPALEEIEDAWDAKTVQAKKSARTNIGRVKAWVRSIGN